jgi:hypothetical protein
MLYTKETVRERREKVKKNYLYSAAQAEFEHFGNFGLPVSFQLFFFVKSCFISQI